MITFLNILLYNFATACKTSEDYTVCPLDWKSAVKFLAKIQWHLQANHVWQEPNQNLKLPYIIFFVKKPIQNKQIHLLNTHKKKKRKKNPREWKKINAS